MNRVIFALMLSVLAACSGEQAYHGLQQGAQNECRHLPPSQIDECLTKNQQGYGEYRRERDAN